MCDLSNQHNSIYAGGEQITDLGQLVFALLCICIIGAFAEIFFQDNKSHRAIIRFVVGAMLVITITPSVVQLQKIDWQASFHNIQSTVDDTVSGAESASVQALQERIIQQTQAYILDTACAMGAQIQVTVRLSDDEIPVPVSAVIQGDVSPYVKRQLSAIMQTDLGISEVDQQWK